MNCLFIFLFTNLLLKTFELKSRHQKQKLTRLWDYAGSYFYFNHIIDWNHDVVDSEKIHSFKITLCEFDITLNFIQKPCYISDGDVCKNVWGLRSRKLLWQKVQSETWQCFWISSGYLNGCWQVVNVHCLTGKCSMGR